MSRTPKVGGIIVAYQPDHCILELIESIYEQFDVLLVCNNGMGDEVSPTLLRQKFPGLELLEMYGNRGIAAALNRGLERLTELSCDFVATFDQDSTFAPSYVQQCLSTYEKLTHAGVDVGIVCPAYIDRNTNESSAKFTFTRSGFRRDYTRTGTAHLVTMAITSGSFMPMRLFDRVGRFVEDMFIDYVDNEFCLRLHRYGIAVVVDDTIEMWHSLGARHVVKVGPAKFSPTNHSPIRKYYISRNRLYCLRRYGRMLPGFVLFECLAMANDFLRVVLFEERRQEKVRNIVRGYRDGLTFRPSWEYR